jgi:hypothetical protein
MPQYRYDIKQNTDEWLAIKVGKFSASTCAELLMDKKTKGYTGLIDRIVEERITGNPSESKTFKGNFFTERGHELEPVNRDDYEMRTFNEVKLVGVVELDDWVLCSPDGLIGDNMVWQAKCPIFNTQKKYLKLVDKHKDLSDNDILKKIDGNYYKQEQFELFVTERKQAVWTSYHPNLAAIDLIIERDVAMIAEIESRLSEAKQEVLSEIKLLKSYE